MSSQESNFEKARIIRDLIADAETDVLHTADEAMSRKGVVTFLRTKLDETERVEINGD